MDWQKLKPYIFYGKCANCSSSNWKIRTIGYIRQERIVGHRKISKKSKQCLSCNKYNDYQWWFGAFLTLLLFVPAAISGAYFFPGEVTYPTSISPRVFFIGIPIFIIYSLFLMAVSNMLFTTNKIVDPPIKENN